GRTVGAVVEGAAGLLGRGVVLGGEQPHRGRPVLAHVQELHTQVGAELLPIAAYLRRIYARWQVEVEHLHLVVGLEPLERGQGRDESNDQVEVLDFDLPPGVEDRKSTRLNSSHVSIWYAV